MMGAPGVRLRHQGEEDGRVSESRSASRPLRPGDVVELRPPNEILATLDDTGATDGTPFMPEMLANVGRRFSVSKRVEKICDTVSGGPARSLRMEGTVFLDDVRCDGSAHGGCQAGCLIYWKEAWLRPVESGSPAESEADSGLVELKERVMNATRRPNVATTAELFRCQATDALLASRPLRHWDVRQYAREFKSGNVNIVLLLLVVGRAVWTTLARRLRLVGWRPLHHHRPIALPTAKEPTLEAGDLVEVRSKDEIAQTLDDHGKMRGLWFDWEMIPYCGGRYRVKERVRRIIDERTGEMIETSSDCLILDGVVCRGEHSSGRWLCPRQIYPYWREAWLRRVEEPTTGRLPEDQTTTAARTE